MAAVTPTPPEDAAGERRSSMMLSFVASAMLVVSRAS
jgi:hypothetical protein